jgi:hypothetical protein
MAGPPEHGSLGPGLGRTSGRTPRGAQEQQAQYASLKISCGSWNQVGNFHDTPNSTGVLLPSATRQGSVGLDTSPIDPQRACVISYPFSSDSSVAKDLALGFRAFADEIEISSEPYQRLTPIRPPSPQNACYAQARRKVVYLPVQLINKNNRDGSSYGPQRSKDECRQSPPDRPQEAGFSGQHRSTEAIEEDKAKLASTRENRVFPHSVRPSTRRRPTRDGFSAPDGVKSLIVPGHYS